MKKLFLLLLISSLTWGALAQNSYSRDEIDIMFELQEEKIGSKLNAVERENKSIDEKIISQDKQIAYQDKSVESLKFIFGILLSVIGLIIAFSAFFVDKRNKERSVELKEEMGAIKEEALEQLTRIRETAKLESRMAQLELRDIKEEAVKLLAQFEKIEQEKKIEKIEQEKQKDESEEKS